MSAPVGSSGYDLADSLRALLVTAADGRTVAVTRAEVQAWARANRQATAADGAAWVGQALTDRWAALGGVEALAFWVAVLDLPTLALALAVTARGQVPRDGWWVAPH